MNDDRIIKFAKDRADQPDRTTSLEECLMHVGRLLRRPMTLAQVQSIHAGSGTNFNVEDLLGAAERAGIQAALGRISLDRIDSAMLPAILLLNHERSVVFEGRGADGSLILFDPALGSGVGEVDQSKIEESYTGYIIVMRAKHRMEDPADAARERGHWFWSTLAKNRWLYIQVALAAVVANLLALTTSIFTMVVYDRVLPNEAVESLVALTIGVGIALFFDFLIKSLRSGFVDRAGQRADVVMGRLIFDNLLDMQMRAKKGSTGALASTLREFESLRDFFTSATLVAVVDLPFIFLFLGVIYMIGGSLALVPALCIPIVLLVGIGVQPLLSRLSDFSSKDGQSKQSILVETLSGLETIKAVGAARQMRARWEEAVERQADHGVRSRAISQFALNITAFVQQGAQVMIVFYGVFLIMDGQVSMGALIGSVMLTGRCLAPLAQLVQTLTRLNQARTSFKSLNALMKSESERPIGRSWLSRPRLEGEITFSDVHFSYPDAVDETLKGLSFHIKKGERVAILGKIGCGKSTVARLILGLYEPKAGAVLIDGTDIRQIDPGDIRRNIGSVLQDVWLFSGTIRDNISIGTMRPQDNDILVASKIAGVDTFVSKHPSGYDMILAERGEGLSGGQRQAITLARALIGRPPILLMDEPTSSMDVQNEAEVISRLSAHIGDRTLVIITHRTSLLELVDRVIVIDQGKVVADGPKSILSHPVSPRQVAEK